MSLLPQVYALYRNLDPRRRDFDDNQALALQVQKNEGHGQTSEDPLNSAVTITFLGVWDTVGALGVPDLSRVLKLDQASRKRHRFHNTYLSPIIRYARHAVAIDEKRKIFRHTEMNPHPGFTPHEGQIRQVWFPGDHGCVGGGGDGREAGDPRKVDKRPHSDAALAWMIDELSSVGPHALKVFRDILDLQPNPLAPLGAEEKRFLRRLSDPLDTPLPPPDKPERDRRRYCAFEDIHPAAHARWSRDAAYRPSNLEAAHGDRLDQGEI